MQELLKSKIFQTLLFVLASLIVLIGMFSLGVHVGERKAQHFSQWSENYNRMFVPRRGFEGTFNLPLPSPRHDMPDAHGAFGKVLTNSGTTIVIQGKDHLEQNVLITSSTVIRVGREDVTSAELHPGVDTAIFGVPNDQGQIEARLIRIMGRP